MRMLLNWFHTFSRDKGFHLNNTGSRFLGPEFQPTFLSEKPALANIFSHFGAKMSLYYWISSYDKNRIKAKFKLRQELALSGDICITTG